MGIIYCVYAHNIMNVKSNLQQERKYHSKQLSLVIVLPCFPEKLERLALLQSNSDPAELYCSHLCPDYTVNVKIL